MSKFEQHLMEAKMKDVPKIRETILKRAQEGERLSKEMARFFQSMIRNIDDMESREGMKIMNAHSKIKDAAKKLGFS